MKSLNDFACLPAAGRVAQKWHQAATDVVGTLFVEQLEPCTRPVPIDPGPVADPLVGVLFERR